MRNFQRKGKFAYFLQSKLMLGILAIIIGLIGFSVIGLAFKAHDTFKNKNIAQEKIIELRNQKVKLLSDIEKLNTESGIEENIRNKFGLAKDGEGVVVIVDDKNAQNKSTEAEPKGFFSFLKNWFK